MYTRCDNASFANFVAAISRTNSNWYEFVQLITATMILTKYTVSHEANSCGDVLQRSPIDGLPREKSGHRVFADDLTELKLRIKLFLDLRL